MNRPLSGLILLAIWGCGAPAPKDIRYAEELCDYCHMTIIDPMFAGQLVTRTGRVYVFDDFAGLAAFLRDERVPPVDVHGLWAKLYLQPDRRIEVQQAVFLRSDRLRSPMSSGIAAFATSAEADSLRSIIGGELLDWDGVLRQTTHQADSGSRKPSVGL